MVRYSHCYALFRNSQPFRLDTLVKVARLLDPVGHQSILNNTGNYSRKAGTRFVEVAI